MFFTLPTMARRCDGALVPRAQDSGAPADLWRLSEVSADKTRLLLPDQETPEIVAATRDWPDWRRAAVMVCPVGEGGAICDGLIYSESSGLIWG
ncbi:hypothetical protein [Ruixingdingia sedimenti]|uniref:Uncharacterized protein n=1 Tax=Ruixingdingia sedimenti TaxID=3073604 RepID=A0ABU1FAK1_9RHOB|nr:hypothetical protein [Xinfangfangia sp. LG-4]MDR5653469.1 hypothetical protein [Xinfangfangia sp. LG-4]